MKYRFFGKKIEPACAYCMHGTPAQDGQTIRCVRCGFVAPYYHCRHFLYDPLRRIPPKRAILPSYSPEDFTL